jgi:hypothetical protein
MSDVVATIRSYARYWADPDPYRVSGEDLVKIFKDAGCKVGPDPHVAKYYAEKVGSNVKIGSNPNPVAWCGVFATMVWRYAGLNVYWSFDKHGKGKKGGGGMVYENAGVSYLDGKGNLDDLSPGDVAIIPHNLHHIIVIDTITGLGEPHLICIEGNAGKQSIKSTIRPLRDPDPNQRIKGFYHIYS